MLGKVGTLGLIGASQDAWGGVVVGLSVHVTQGPFMNVNKEETLGSNFCVQNSKPICLHHPQEPVCCGFP